jgi:hypothetical protein
MNTSTIRHTPTGTTVLQRVRSDSAYGAFVLRHALSVSAHVEISGVVVALLGADGRPEIETDATAMRSPMAMPPCAIT